MQAWSTVSENNEYSTYIIIQLIVYLCAIVWLVFALDNESSLVPVGP